MDFPELHDWSLAPKDAIALQRELAQQLVLQDRLSQPITTVAGVDVSCRLHSRRFHAAVVLCSFPQLEVLTTVTASCDVDFPYIPGLLSFRELPVVLQAMKKLAVVPDLLLVDGQGLAHPRRLGLACHLGLWLDLPSIGCGKSRLYGEHAEVGVDKGAQTPLFDKAGEPIGSLLRTRSQTKPLYISPGHRVCIATASHLALACCGRYRLPDPIRAAHAACNRQRLQDEAG